MRLAVVRAATSTPTPARGRSTPRCRRSSSSTARGTTTASGRCSRAISRITAGTCSPSTFRDTAGPAATRCRRSRRSRTGFPRCSMRRASSDAAARRPFAGVAGGARMRGAPSRARRAKLALLGPAAPMPVSEALLDAAQRNDHVACELITGWSYSAGKQLGGSQMPGMWLTGNAMRLLERTKPGVLHADLVACDRYGAGADSAARRPLPGARHPRRARHHGAAEERRSARSRRCPTEGRHRSPTAGTR